MTPYSKISRSLYFCSVLILLNPFVAQAKVRTSADGIPVFDITTSRIVKGKKQNFRVKDIPKLSISKEPLLKPTSFVNIANIQAMKLNLRDPKFVKPVDEVIIKPELQRLVQPVSEPKKFLPLEASKSADQSFKEVTQINVMPAKLNLDNQKQEIKFANFTPEELLLTQGLIYLQIHKDFEMALGLFAELATKPAFKDLADYYLADVSLGLNVLSEHRHRMLSILQNSEFKQDALTSLIENAKPGDLKTTKQLIPYLPKVYPDSPQFLVNLAKVKLEQKEISEAIDLLKKVPDVSPEYVNARYLLGISFYRMGNTQEALTVLENLRNYQSDILDVKNNLQQIRSLLSLTLARMKFQKGEYIKAIEHYLEVDKKDPDWLSAMTEMAWAQVLNKDFEGAAGNMFPLHTEFFRKMYAPDSYTSRTVAYLNLCQYGDAKKVLTDFKNKYKPFSDQIALAQKNLSSPEQYYQLIQIWATNPKPGLIQQVPSEFLAHLIRHPSFIEEQKQINDLEDQIITLNKIALSILAKEKKIKEEQANLTKQESKEKEKMEIDEEVLKMKSQINSKSRRAFAQFRKEALVRIDSEKTEHKILAGKSLQQRYAEVQRKTLESLDQVDVLEYELFSGAGEHLRFQMAGGKIDPKEKVDPNKDRKMNWDFTGELWEDEIGHFQSSLKNVCLPETN